MPNYQCVRRDRDCHGGDVSMYVRQLKWKSQSISTLCNGTSCAFTTKEKADVLSLFKQCFTEPLSFVDMDMFGATTQHPEEFLCTVDEVSHLLETAKATCPYGIPARILKILAPTIALSVNELFNLSLQSGLFPITWKCSTIVPIPIVK